MADHTGPATRVSLRNSISGRTLNPSNDILRINHKPRIIIQEPIKRLPNTGKYEQIHLAILTDTVPVTILQYAPMRITHGPRRGQDDWAGEKTGFVDPVGPRQFAATVEAEDAREGGVGRPVLAGEDCGHACVC